MGDIAAAQRIKSRQPALKFTDVIISIPTYKNLFLCSWLQFQLFTASTDLSESTVKQFCLCDFTLSCVLSSHMILDILNISVNIYLRFIGKL